MGWDKNAMNANESSLVGYLKSLGTVIVATLVSWAMYGHFDDANLIMVYLLATVFSATRFGRWPALLASCLSVLAFDFFFVPPHFSLEVSNAQYLFTLGVMLVVALVVSNLTANLRSQATLASRIEEETRRNALLSAISHDFRTPLSAILGASSSLLDDAAYLPESVKRQFVQTIHDESQRMVRLANNVLDLARFETDAMTLDREWYPVEELVGIVLTRLRQRLVGHAVSLNLNPDLPMIFVDAVMIDAVLENLLENAIKYTPHGTAIEIGARASPGMVEVWVADRGPGLPPGSERRVFEKFQRLSTEGARYGAGLGLTICDAIVHSHGGTIVAENRPGGGAMFRFTIPLTEAPPQIEVADRESDLPA